VKWDLKKVLSQDEVRFSYFSTPALYASTTPSLFSYSFTILYLLVPFLLPRPLPFFSFFLVSFRRTPVNQLILCIFGSL
jgi:hypothetical protein